MSSAIRKTYFQSLVDASELPIATVTARKEISVSINLPALCSPIKTYKISLSSDKLMPRMVLLDFATSEIPAT